MPSTTCCRSSTSKCSARILTQTYLFSYQISCLSVIYSFNILSFEAFSTCSLSSFNALAFICRWYNNSLGVLPTKVSIPIIFWKEKASLINTTHRRAFSLQKWWTLKKKQLGWGQLHQWSWLSLPQFFSSFLFLGIQGGGREGMSFLLNVIRATVVGSPWFFLEGCRFASFSEWWSDHVLLQSELVMKSPAAAAIALLLSMDRALGPHSPAHSRCTSRILKIVRFVRGYQECRSEAGTSNAYLPVRSQGRHHAFQQTSSAALPKLLVHQALFVGLLCGQVYTPWGQGPFLIWSVIPRI